MSDPKKKASHLPNRERFRFSLSNRKKKLPRRPMPSPLTGDTQQLSKTPSGTTIVSQLPNGTEISVTTGASSNNASGSSTKVGYIRERTAYSLAKRDLIRAYPGKFVVFLGEQMIGPFDTFPTAVGEAYRQFGRRPIYTKELIPDDSVR